MLMLVIQIVNSNKLQKKNQVVGVFALLFDFSLYLYFWKIGIINFIVLISILGFKNKEFPFPYINN